MSPHTSIDDELNSMNSTRNDTLYTQQMPLAKNQRIDFRSILASLCSTLLLRFANRASFVLLSFYLGEHFASATVVALILETFYVSELALAPIAGNLSDRLGRKPFLSLAPIMGACANVCLLIGALLYPHPNSTAFDPRLIVLLLIILAGRLLEGTTTAFSTPASLGYITDVTVGSERLRTRCMTIFEIATVCGMALGIPFGGKISSLLGIWGFFVIIILHILNIVIVTLYIKERMHCVVHREKRTTLRKTLYLLRDKQILGFLPAWLSINALIGSWMTLIIVILTYPGAVANLRHPGQLLYGGFSKAFATYLLGGFGLIFMFGMILWMLILPRLRRTTAMLCGLGGLATCIVALSIINGVARQREHLPDFSNRAFLILVPIVVLGIVFFSSFPPTALTHMAAIAEKRIDQRGAVMGMYSVVLGVGQMVGTLIGGMAVDLAGFYGLMIFSGALTLIALVSVCYIRICRQDLTAGFSADG